MKNSALNLFCLVVFTAMLIFTGRAQADTVLYNFPGSATDGTRPYATPIHDTYGNLYGTTTTGGAFGYGTVYVLCAPGVSGSDLFPCTTGLPSWTEFVLYSFKGLPSSDGANPYGALVFNGLYAGRAFTLYGTTYNGGKPDTCGANGAFSGCGTVFELCAPSNFGGCGGVNIWKEKVLYRFLGVKDGAHPLAGVITDKASDLFGTTVYGGGLGSCIPSGSANQFCGTVFKLKGQSPWTFPETIMHRFKGGTTDGANPYSALCCNTIFAIPYVYGTTVLGGSHASGIVYRVKNAGAFPKTTLYNFCSLSGCFDGANPYSDVIFDSTGHLYGTTIVGGPSGWGIAYELTPAGPPWTETLLYNFLGPSADGGSPTAGVIFDASGNLYGTTLNAGSGCATCGIVFELSPSGPPWSETVLWNFVGPPDGDYPFAGVTFDSAVSSGTLYGATVYGGTGSGSLGTIYSVP
jgi:uncharacterized repeat protein (TIGR03803 family)